MRWLLFLARVAFICNVLFLLCLIILFTKDFIHSEFFKSIIIVLGWFLSFPVNFTVNTTEIVLLLSRKPSQTPNWLRIFNFIVFILQIIIFFFVHHDTFHT
jgi:hypothetical protein